MSLKKKLAVSTLAVSMAAASVAGFPFSSEGLAKHLTGVASAAAVDHNAVKAKITAIYNNLTATEVTYLQNYSKEVAGIDQAKFEDIFAPVLGKLQLNSEDKATSLKLFKSVSSVVYDVYASDFDVLKGIRYDVNNVKLFNNIAAKAKVDSLSFDDILDFFFATNGVEAELRALLGSKSTADMINLIGNPESQKTLVKDAVYKVLEHKTGVGALTVSDAVYNLGITADDLVQTFDNVNTQIKSAKPAAQALALAYIRTNPLVSGGGTGGGTTVTTPGATPGVYDVSALVSVVNGKATLKLVDADVLKAFDALLAANPGKTGLTLTLNLGTVTATTVEVPLSKAIIEAAKAKGIANIAVTFNGLTVTIPVGQFSDAVTLTVTTEADTTVTSITSLKLASKVYSFDLTVGGVATTTFKQPLTIKLPLVGAASLDKELLSVSKIVYGKLQFQGGVVDGDFIVEPRDTFSSYAVVENKVSFSDTASVQAWAGRQIQVVAAKGAIEGIGSGKFAPKSNVTRAEFAKMLIRALNLENSTATESFSDVSSTAWYAPYVAVAAEKGIITGRNASTFDPNATITRAEMATMISRAVKALKPAATADATALSKFSDAAKISASLKDGVAFAASNNLVIGNAGKFNPNATATRAEAAVIIYRTMNFK
ncbi:S-layer homology domain-containing protein [Paenibacillus tianjinensis]|uniref:S-layer homology domain-containing protein n=1 Tax=Paenibacillus tianjinensis TaxID=2810347 RepID=A0ABX7L800_9BACL|nr:S-layer homology domain-containing protein [Paenibacillus tianjinensis]QSF44122.1 S-layer homology domain-containing protein [Paenibacillus tianjinensis]